MPTTTSYGSWFNHQGHELNIETSVVVALGDYGREYDVDAIARDWAEAINEALPHGVTLAGDEFYGPAYAEDRDWDGDLDITAAIEGVDFWAIAEKHELWDIDRVAEHLGHKGPSATGTARKTLSRLGVKADSYRPHPDSGRPQAIYRAQDVRDAQAARPGRGTRTDLKGDA